MRVGKRINWGVSERVGKRSGGGCTHSFRVALIFRGKLNAASGSGKTSGEKKSILKRRPDNIQSKETKVGKRQPSMKSVC